MSLYLEEKIELIESYIKDPSNNNFYDTFSDRYDIIMVVDWREMDEDIISYCEEIINTKSLSVELDDCDNKQGFTLTIYYKDKSLIVPYQGDGADRDTTLLALNEILQPDYEIRFCVESNGSDTLVFMPLPKLLWQQLEDKYPDQVAKLFEKFTSSSEFFGC
ncbi:hypothetical protein [Proteus terrae]|uniref:hypothetical protein n=1 Tax=Proteus terrae TaxID=1574161 RepID=UPI00298CD1C4|nr:hypothetical protein [Proteus terrae]WPD00873.1 hypothetical protein R5P25_10270 [Proteus terrae]